MPQFRARILLVDDNEINVKVGKLMLEKFGITVTVAISGEQAVGLSRQNIFDLVMMDVSMYGMSGMEACRQIRLNPSYFCVPFIAWTAHSSVADQEEFLAAGMDDCLIKPIGFSTLQQMLERWLHHQSCNSTSA